MGVTLMKINPVNFYTSMRSRMENSRRVSERRTEMFKEYEEWVSGAEAFKKKHGLKSERQIADAATKFVLNNPDVHCVCPTINTFEVLEQFVALSGQKLESDDKSMLDDYASTSGRFYCRHACGICESSCPQSVPVNTVMRYNHYFEAQGREKQAMTKYEKLMQSAQHCESCAGFCADACPHHVPIRNLLAHAHKNLTLV
jgi:predicted aldo/keto reductase-like oxidoreductase